MIRLGIDPGPTESGWCFLHDGPSVSSSGVDSNDWIAKLLREVHRDGQCDEIAIEMIASYGMPVGREVFDTCLWIGEFRRIWRPDSVQLIPRGEVKLALCGSARAKDANVRQALIDLLGPKGTKKNPGPTYGVKSHAWAALAVAVTAWRRSACIDTNSART